MVTVPAEFADGWETAEERAWLAGLPALAERCLRRWDLTVDGEPMYGYVALVVPVRRADGTAAALKLPWPHEEAEHEALALSLWDGDGAVRLLAHDPGDWSMLLERLDPGSSLEDEPIEQAVPIAAGLLRRLDRPADPRLRTLTDKARQWAGDLAAAPGDVPADLIAQAVAYCRELGPRAGNRLVNEDMHYENVLRGEREPWLVIDPKPLAGDPEFGVLPLLWNRIGDTLPRLHAITAAAGMDADLARRWAFVRSVQAWAEGGHHAADGIARALA